MSRGIIVNDYLETSDPDVFAVGECTEHRGEVYGLVAPLFEQGKVLAATIPGIAAPSSKAGNPPPSSKSWASTSSPPASSSKTPGTESVRYEDPGSGVYKKLLVRDNKLVGCVLVGDASDSNRYMDWLRSNTDLTVRRKNLLFPRACHRQGFLYRRHPGQRNRLRLHGRHQGPHHLRYSRKRHQSMAQLKECTRATTGCGTCAGVCEGLLKAVAPDFQEVQKKVLCKCVPFTQDELRDIIRTQKLKSVQDVLDIYGNGIGCEICKPALSYLVDVVWCGDHDEDRSARFINDRVHANIQNDGTFSVVPRMRGGVTTPAELRKIADVAERYNARLVKVTGSQRIDLLGIKKTDLPAVWADLGMPSRPGLHQRRPHGENLRRHGVLPLRRTGRHDHRHRTRAPPRKPLHAAQNEARRHSAAPATAPKSPSRTSASSARTEAGRSSSAEPPASPSAKPTSSITVETTEEAIEATMLFFQYYRENGHYLERSYDFVERLGMEKIRKETVYATDVVKQGLLDRLQRSKDRSSDAWLERYNPRPFQFAPIEVASNGLVQIETKEKAHV